MRTLIERREFLLALFNEEELELEQVIEAAEELLKENDLITFTTLCSYTLDRFGDKAFESVLNILLKDVNQNTDIDYSRA